MNPSPSTPTVSLKLTSEQFHWLQNTARFIESETQCQVSQTSILLRLMELGLPHFEKEVENLRAKANADKKRFPKLQLIYTRPPTPADRL